MKIDFKQETESGPVSFTGELTIDEVTFLVEYAITDLVKKGLIPLSVSKDPDSIAKYAQGSTELQ